MTDEPAVSTPPAAASNPVAAAPEATALLDPITVLMAVADPVRYAILRELARGTPLPVKELARRVGRAPDATSKHLRVLRDARILSIVRSAGEDGRKQIHELPALFRSRDAAGKPLADLGAVVLRFG
jgi:DNA-binding transcriptional ArsR family regulator